MSQEITVALVAVSGSLIGAAVGGAASFFSTRSARILEWRLASLEKEIEKKEKLFSDFLSETNALMLASMNNKKSNAEEFAKIASLETMMWFCSSDVGNLARKLTACVMANHTAGASDHDYGFPKLRDEFIARCDEHLNSLRKSARKTW